MTDTAYKPLTDIPALAEIPEIRSQGFTRKGMEALGWSWQHMSDAEHQLAELRGIDIDTARAIVSGVRNGLPLQIKMEHRLNGTNKIETVTSMAVLEQVFISDTAHAIRGRAWGLGVYLNWGDLIEVTVPHATYEFREA